MAGDDWCESQVEQGPLEKKGGDDPGGGADGPGGGGGILGKN